MIEVTVALIAEVVLKIESRDPASRSCELHLVRATKKELEDSDSGLFGGGVGQFEQPLCALVSFLFRVNEQSLTGHRCERHGQDEFGIELQACAIRRLRPAPVARKISVAPVLQIRRAGGHQ